MLILLGWLLVAVGAVMLVTGWTLVFGVLAIAAGLGLVALGARRPTPMQATGEQPRRLAQRRSRTMRRAAAEAADRLPPPERDPDVHSDPDPRPPDPRTD